MQLIPGWRQGRGAGVAITGRRQGFAVGGLLQLIDDSNPLRRTTLFPRSTVKVVSGKFPANLNNYSLDITGPQLENNWACVSGAALPWLRFCGCAWPTGLGRGAVPVDGGDPH